jgi:DNA-binding PadR family transcriptional regulator
MKTRDTSLLGRALLGLLYQAPSSGYDIRRTFTQTPMATFSDSPGAIYPALKRLETGGLIRGQVQNSSGRRRKVFRLTTAGVSSLKHWLRQPVTHDDVVRRTDELMLRFGFMEQVVGEANVVAFLKALRQELSAYIPSLREYLNAHQSEMPRSGRLALESGVRGYETLLEWSKHAITNYETEAKGGKP